MNDKGRWNIGKPKPKTNANKEDYVDYDNGVEEPQIQYKGIYTTNKKGKLIEFPPFCY